jgi:hypothetical protein
MTTEQKVAPRGVTDPDDFPALPDSLRRPPVVAKADIEHGSQHFHLGETAPALVPDDNAHAAAIEAAGRVAENLQGSNEFIIRAGVEAFEAKVRFGNDRAVYYDSFIAALVAKNVLTKRDGQLADESSKLSKLLTIGQSADILRHPEIFSRLPQGYSALYEAIGLLKKLPGDENAQSQRLVEILIEGERQQNISRQFLIDQKREANPRKKHGNGLREPVVLPDSGARLILVTPNLRDLRKLEEDVSEHSLPACMRLKDLSADECDAVIVVPIWAIPVVKSRMIDQWGAVERVLLLGRADAPDITDAEVAVIAARGAGNREIEPFEWCQDSAELDSLDLAERLFPNSANKLHVFADEPQGDWNALVGEENWRTEP